MAKFSILSVSLVSALASIASAVPVEPRWFPTCDITKQGTRTGATAAADVVAAKGTASFTVGTTETELARVTLNGITTIITAFAASGSTQTSTYNLAADVARTISQDCTFLGCGTSQGASVCYIAGSRSLASNDNLVIKVSGDHS